MFPRFWGLILLLAATSCNTFPELSAIRLPRDPPKPLGAERTVFACCNLRVLDETEITWRNWQSVDEFLPVGTELLLSGGPREYVLRDPRNGRTFNLDIGAPGDDFLEKFVVSSPRSSGDFSPEAREAIEKGVARIGMTRREIYAALGPPHMVGDYDTDAMTLEQIENFDTWVWRRGTFAEKIVVRFSPGMNLVLETEGVHE
ncbi:MAG: outer membrane protein assembly factor BamE [Planctomycetes bacterium]|jgi:hypothetical protein|nr:outer membrane protein assembly factor BamE [Planctomycetota bacterium]